MVLRFLSVLSILLMTTSARADVDVERDGDPIFFPDGVPQGPAPYAPYAYPFGLSRPQATTLAVGLVTGVPSIVMGGAMVLAVVAPPLLVIPFFAGFVAVGAAVAAPAVAVQVAHEPAWTQSATLVGTVAGASVVGFVAGAAAGGAAYVPLQYAISQHVFRSEDGDGGWGLMMMLGIGALTGVAVATTTTTAITTSLLEERGTTAAMPATSSRPP